MHPRSIRPQIYLPVVRFGVVDRDWKFVIFSTIISYSIPFLTGTKLFGFPLEIWTSIATLVGSVAFFNFVRIGRRPFWLQHQISALTKQSRQRHTLPSDKKSLGWLIHDEPN